MPRFGKVQATWMSAYHFEMAALFRRFFVMTLIAKSSGGSNVFADGASAKTFEMVTCCHFIDEHLVYFWCPKIHPALHVVYGKSHRHLDNP